MSPRLALPALLGLLALASFGFAASRAPEAPAPGTSPPDSLQPSSWWLGLLPDGETKRKFILDCTGCHQFNETRARSGGQPRSREQWAADVGRMLRYAGARSGFPVIAADRDSAATAAWLHAELSKALGAGGPARKPPRTVAWAAAPRAGAADIREYDLPVPMDLPHDVAVDAKGRVLVTGMFTHQVLVLDPESGAFTSVAIPVEKSNPRAIEVDALGDWWLVLGGPQRLARWDAGSERWTSWHVGLYAHSLARGADGRVWFNGHFTRDPELIGAVDAGTGVVTLDTLPPHPALAREGGPVPYELRVAPDGAVWMSELQGNRIVRYDPRTRASKAWTLPVTWSGPRRFDIDRDGVLWIPEYANGRLLRFDPKTERFLPYVLPIADSAPYVARVHPATGHVWIGTGAADAVFRFDPVKATFEVFRLPTRGATVRHLAFDPRTRDVWVAYGASPAMHPARVARLRPRG